jgi:hypothetical protein
MNLLNGWAFAESREMPVDLHVVVHWERLDLIAGQSILAAQAAFLNRLSKWLKKRSKPLAYLWTIEFSPKKGHHTHLLLSAGRLHACTLGELLRSLPKLLVGDDRTLHPCVIRAARNKSPLPYDSGKYSRVARTLAQRRGLIAYDCKGFAPDVAAKVGVHAENQGKVRFRRCGVSRSLDWTARQQAGWQEQPLEQFDFSDLAEKRRASLARRFQGRSGALGGPPRTQPSISLPRGSMGLGSAPTGPAAP